MPDIYGKIAAAGSSLDGVRIRVIQNGNERWYCAPDTVEKEMLATALSAVTSGYNCLVRVESDAEYSKIEYIYLYPNMT